MESKKHIFLSYSRNDEKFVFKFADDLQRCNLDVWVDQFEIPDGAHWDDTIEEALDNSKAMILIISPSSANSVVVKNEVSYAEESGIQIFPILYKKTKLPLSWRRLHYTELNEKNYDKKIEGFVKNLANYTNCELLKVNIPPKKTKKIWLKLMALFLVSLGAIYLFINNKEHIIPIDNGAKEVITKKVETKEINITTKIEPIVKPIPKVEVEKPKEIKTISKPEPKPIIVHKPIIQKRNIPEQAPKVETQPILQPKKTTPSLTPLSASDPYASIFNQYILELQRDATTKLVVISHTNANNEYDTAQKRAFSVSLDLRERGLKRAMIVTKIEPDGEDRVTFDFRKVIR